MSRWFFPIGCVIIRDILSQMLKDLYTYLQKVSQITVRSLFDKSLLYCVCIIFISLSLPQTSQAVPDTKLTLKKYSDSKFEFLVHIYCKTMYPFNHHAFLTTTFSELCVHACTCSWVCLISVDLHRLSSQAYCLKVKEMDDEEYEAAVSDLCHAVLSLWPSIFLHMHVYRRGSLDLTVVDLLSLLLLFSFHYTVGWLFSTFACMCVPFLSRSSVSMYMYMPL